MRYRYMSPGWRRCLVALPVGVALLGCGQSKASSPDALNDTSSAVVVSNGISQSSDINQSTSGSGGNSSSSVSVSQQTIDNGDGTVTIIETRTVNGKTETTRRTVRRTDSGQNQNQSIEQRIEQK